MFESPETGPDVAENGGSEETETPAAPAPEVPSEGESSPGEGSEEAQGSAEDSTES